MMDFVVIMAAFVVGNLVTLGLVYSVMFNPKVLKWMTKKMYKLSQEIEDEILDEEFE